VPALCDGSVECLDDDAVNLFPFGKGDLTNILEGTKLIMTDSHGTPVRRSSGDTVTHQLKEGEDPDTWAKILTKQFRQHIHGDRKLGFSGPLSYPETGWR